MNEQILDRTAVQINTRNAWSTVYTKVCCNKWISCSVFPRQSVTLSLAYMVVIDE